MKTTWPAPGPRYDALLGLLRAADTIWNSSRTFFAPWGVGPSQFNILNLLRDKPDGLSQVELSRQLIMHRSNVTGLVDRLEEKGWVRRREHPSDRRAYRVVLSPAGAALLKKITPEYYRAAEEVWGDLPVARVAQLRTSLEEVARRAESMATRPRAARKAGR
jgi:DNA-binding MarR family transcriptional regulator